MKINGRVKEVLDIKEEGEVGGGGEVDGGEEVEGGEEGEDEAGIKIEEEERISKSIEDKKKFMRKERIVSNSNRNLSKNKRRQND